MLALAALERLGLVGHVAEVLDPDTVLPQVGQGALAVECRGDDAQVLAWLHQVDDARARAQVEAERAFLGALGGGCTLPLGALAQQAGSGPGLVVEGMMASRDGRILLRRSVSGDDSDEVGTRLARTLLDDCGGSSLEDWDFDVPAGGPGRRP
ncbi:MAG: hypothetical protein ABSG81_10200 [Acidimicrobiales bacterium]